MVELLFEARQFNLLLEPFDHVHDLVLLNDECIPVKVLVEAIFDADKKVKN